MHNVIDICISKENADQVADIQAFATGVGEQLKELFPGCKIRISVGEVGYIDVPQQRIVADIMEQVFIDHRKEIVTPGQDPIVTPLEQPPGHPESTH